MRNFLTVTLISLSTVLQAGQGTWEVHSSIDEFTDVETRIAMTLSPSGYSTRGETIALFVTCDEEGNPYSGVIWEDLLGANPWQTSVFVTYRVGKDEPVTVEGEIDRKARTSTYFFADQGERVIDALRDAAAEREEIIFGVETFKSEQQVARFEMEGFAEAIGGVLKFCGSRGEAAQ